MFTSSLFCEMYSFYYHHRVRYRECDAMGFVYHAHYIDYFDAARTDALRCVGIPVKKLENDGILLPVVDLAIAYKRPGHYDDLLTILCTIAEPPGARLMTRYEVYREQESKPICTAHVTVCFFDTRRHRPVRAPARVVTALSRAVQGTRICGPVRQRLQPPVLLDWRHVLSDDLEPAPLAQQGRPQRRCLRRL